MFIAFFREFSQIPAIEPHCGLSKVWTTIVGSNPTFHPKGQQPTDFTALIR